MFSAVVYGLIAALGWGTADFLAKHSSDRIGYFRTTFFMQAGGAIFILLFTIQDLHLIVEYPTQSLETVVIAIIGTFGVLALYRGFETGRVSVVSPISSSFPALSTVLAILLLNESLSAIGGLGIAVTIVGIVAISTDQSIEQQHPAARLGKSVAYGVAAFASFGVTYFALKLVVGDLGPWIPILIIRCVAASLLGPVLIAKKPQVKSPNSTAIYFIIVVAILDALANVSYNFGIISSSVSIVATVSALFSAVTVLLARLQLKERLAKRQGIGILAILVGVAVLSYFG
jgi:drug/metabolite transporter (DMT)-like permease